MKLKILLSIIPLLTISVSLFAKSVLLDSVGVENLDGKKVILHKLDPKDNYYSLGRRYNVKPAAIIKFNNNVALKIGSIIKVPTDRPFLEQTRPAYTQQTQPAATTPVTATANTVTGPVIQDYKVSAGETLYSIAKRFNSTVDDITKLNGLTSTTVVPGEIIKVRSGVAEVPPPVVKKDTIVAVSPQDSINNEFHINANRYGLFEKSEKGVATWTDDPGLDPNKKIVLHRTAPVGTVIKITNPMTGRSTFAKVVGSFADSEETKDVILIMTKNVADSIGALDKRVHVDINYGSLNQ